MAEVTMIIASRGDIRFGYMGGFEPFDSDDDVRSNISAGGQVAKAEIGERELEIAEMVRPQFFDRTIGPHAVFRFSVL